MNERVCVCVSVKLVLSAAIKIIFAFGVVISCRCFTAVYTLQGEGTRVLYRGWDFLVSFTFFYICNYVYRYVEHIIRKSGVYDTSRARERVFMASVPVGKTV